MAEIKDLVAYRNDRRNRWLRRNGSRLEAHIHGFIHRKVAFSFAQVRASYIVQRQNQAEYIWSYEELRELVHQNWDENFVDALYAELKAEPWFDATILPKDLVSETCINLYLSL